MYSSAWQLYGDKHGAKRPDFPQLFQGHKARVRTEHDSLPKQQIGELYGRAANDDVPKRRAAHSNLAVVAL